MMSSSMETSCSFNVKKMAMRLREQSFVNEGTFLEAIEVLEYLSTMAKNSFHFMFTKSSPVPCGLTACCCAPVSLAHHHGLMITMDDNDAGNSGDLNLKDRQKGVPQLCILLG